MVRCIFMRKPSVHSSDGLPVSMSVEVIRKGSVNEMWSGITMECEFKGRLANENQFYNLRTPFHSVQAFKAGATTLECRTGSLR